MKQCGQTDDCDRLHRLESEVRNLADRIDELYRAIVGGQVSQEVVGESANAKQNQSGTVDVVGDAKPYQRTPHPPLPDSMLVRRLIRNRQIRAEIFGEGLFGEPAWDMLLDLTAASIEQKRVSVSSLCIASGVPHTTALRWISLMISYGIFYRTEDGVDRRRSYVHLTKKGMRMAAIYFSFIS
jgi:hypothetical protein